MDRGRGQGFRRKFSRSPLVVIWEVTRACDLACVHCRAEAIPRREPGELTLGEGTNLIRQIREVCLEISQECPDEIANSRRLGCHQVAVAYDPDQERNRVWNRVWNRV